LNILLNKIQVHDIDAKITKKAIPKKNASIWYQIVIHKISSLDFFLWRDSFIAVIADSRSSTLFCSDRNCESGTY
jgi:hypothetical protein